MTCTKDQIQSIAAILFCGFMLLVPGKNVSLISFGAITYFIWDLNYQKTSIPILFIVHHILSICAFFWILFTDDKIATLFIDSAKAMEYSNVTLYLNHLLIVFHLKDWSNQLYRFFFLVHVINYMYWRLVYVGVKLIQHVDIVQENIVIALTLIIYFGGYYWSILLIRKCYHHAIWPFCHRRARARARARDQKKYE